MNNRDRTVDDSNIICSVGDINIGEIIYRVEDSYNTLYRINNIYKYGVDVIKDSKFGGGKSIYIDYNTLIDEYIRIKPHGYLEFTVMELQSSEDEKLYNDLRVSLFTKDIETGGLYISSSGLLLTPAFDIYGEYSNMCMSGVDTDDSHNFLHGGVKESSRYRIAIAYYFSDSIAKLMSFLDDVFEITIRKLVTEFIEKDIYSIYDENLSYIAGALYNDRLLDRYEFTDFIRTSLAYKRVLNRILDDHNGVRDEIHTNFNIAEDGMFEDEDIVAELRQHKEFPDYPYFASEYKLHIDLNNIKNPYVILYTCDYDDFDDNNNSVYIVMTLSHDDRINKNIHSNKAIKFY